MTFRREATLTVAARLIGAYLAVCFRTVRWRLVIAPEADPALRAGGAVLAFWHEHLPAMPMLWRLAGPTHAGRRRAHVLISRHRDGRMIAAVVRRFGLHVIEGSSGRSKNGVWTDRGGGVAFKELADRLVAGDYVALTPDGPRGPRRRAAGGAGRLARTADAALLPCAALTRPAIPLRTWDRMTLPVPFGRGVIVVAPPVALEPGPVPPPDGTIPSGSDPNGDAEVGRALDAVADAAVRALHGRTTRTGALPAPASVSGPGPGLVR